MRKRTLKTYQVTATPKNYKGDVVELEFYAYTKAEAIKKAKNHIWNHGHFDRLDGAIVYSATKID